MKNRRTRNSNENHNYQSLEQRQLLAGNVTATLQTDSLLIVGDSAANQIQIVGSPNGHVQVIGLTGTTVNTGDTPFAVNRAVRNVTIQMGGGNDSVEIAGLVANGFLDVNLGSGNDSLRIRDIRVQVLNVDASDGNDVMQFHNTYSLGNITLYGRDGDNTISITAMATDRTLIINSGSGADTIAINNLGVRDSFLLSTGGGNDQVIMTGQVYAHQATLDLGSGNDTLAIVPSTNGTTAVFQRSLNIRAGAGDDTVFLGANTSSRKSTSLDGGAGNDSVGASGASLKKGRFDNFQNRNLASINAALDTFYANLQSAGIDTTPFGRAFVAPILTVQSSPLKHYGSTSATALDDSLVISAPTATTISQATLRITGGYVNGQDVLAFANTGNLSGSFNAATGVLTLTGNATAAEYQAALRSVTYNNTQTSTLEQTRQVAIELTSNRGVFSGTRNIDLGDQLAIEAYLAANGLTTQTTATGLHYIIDQVGNGVSPTINDTVRVNYVGRLTNGTQFDANNNITFPLTNVIVGWQQGIPLLSVGGRGRLIIPSSLGYGPSGTGNIPPNAILIFDVDLLGIV